MTVDVADRFLEALAGVTDPEGKRKIIGREFIRAFEGAVRDTLGASDSEFEFLVQGTLYPDVVESGGGTGTANIKSHHNVGGLPDDLKFELSSRCGAVQGRGARGRPRTGPARGHRWRQPFPGPGLGIRIVGEVTAARLDTLRRADAIAREELTAAGLDTRSGSARWCCWPTCAAWAAGRRPDLRPPDRAASGVERGCDDRGLDAVAVRRDRTISTRITNEVPEVNRVVLDVTSKPPGTIEWE